MTNERQCAASGQCRDPATVHAVISVDEAGIDEQDREQEVHFCERHADLVKAGKVQVRLHDKNELN
jgi:hypothetical protein